MKTSLLTIESIKNCFRCHNGLYIDHAKDPQNLLQYIYRLERLNIISVYIENKYFSISVYQLNENQKINFITSN